MKKYFFLLLLVAIVSAQFSGFGNGLRSIGNKAANGTKSGLKTIASNLPGGKLGSKARSGLKTAATTLRSVPVVSKVKDFADYSVQTGKSYGSEVERKLREKLFSARKALVDANNAGCSLGPCSYQLAVNAFADLTKAEFLQKLTGNRKSASGDNKAKQHRQHANKNIRGKIPKTFDWREKGGVTPVKFQGDCNSCWSFAVTGAIEGHVFRKTGNLLSLSEQHLIDCGMKEFGLDGCDGGYQEYGFDFVRTQQGIALSSKYPYVDKKDMCSYSEDAKGAEIKAFAVIQPNDETTMKKVIAKLGPLACSVNGLESLLLYEQGIYADEECNDGELNHSVLVVGYGTENGQNYWIVKNSWDKAWGEDGYFRLPRGKNFCGIASECSYPIL